MNRKRPIFLIEHLVYVVLSLVSPYIYAWFTVFGTPERDTVWFKAMIFFEGFFSLNIIFTFFVEYDVDDQIEPVRDLLKIAKNYLKGQFIIEIIPLLPL